MIACLYRDSASNDVSWGRRRCLQYEIATVDFDADADSAGRLESFGRAHSRALQSGAPAFSGVDWSGGNG
jgi:hypothetical protein